jgi:DnaJ-domain-containing protein 1
MDQIFNRLANLLRSVFDDDPFDSSTIEETKKRYNDPDLAEAWEELDEYLKTGRSEAGSTNQKQRPTETFSSAYKQDLEALRKDYSNLEVPFGSPFEEVRKSYKHLLRKYHPDKFANDPNKVKIATEITKKINESYQKLKVFTEKYQKKQ